MRAVSKLVAVMNVCESTHDEGKQIRTKDRIQDIDTAGLIFGVHLRLITQVGTA